jgi:hypothetical protein
MIHDYSKLDPANPNRLNNNKPTNPNDLFSSLPNYGQKRSALWYGQSNILKQWFEVREDSDVLLSLNTGSGKTMVGLLIAKSFINQGKQRVLYVCNDNCLVEQTKKEALNLFGTNQFSVYVGTKEEKQNAIDLYLRGNSFCITNYDALFNGKTVFKKRDNIPEVILFDDAHVAMSKVRSKFTVSIERSKHEQLYTTISQKFVADFKAQNRSILYQEIIDGTDKTGIFFIHPSWILRAGEEIEKLINEYIQNMNDKEKDLNLFFSYENLKSHIWTCTFFVSASKIEIAPQYLPILTLPYFKDDVQRLYLTASAESELEALRCFGKKAKVITTDTKEGLGDRLFIFSDSQQDTLQILQSVNKKFLISTPSKTEAERWNTFGTPVTDSSTYNDKLQEFKDFTKLEAWFLVGRYDGIDFPEGTCRLMVVDGEPVGSTLLQQFTSSEIGASRFKNEQTATRLTQLFGRIIRGSNDFGVFIIEKSLQNWLLNERNQDLLPSLIKEQIKISQDICSQINPQNDTHGNATLIKDFIERNPDLVNLHSNLKPPEIDETEAQQSSNDAENLIKIAEAESAFALNLWNGDPQEAIDVLNPSLSLAEKYDIKVAGWQNLSLGACYEKEKDFTKANIHYIEGRKRIEPSKIARVPLITSEDIIPERFKYLQSKIITDLAEIEEALKVLAPYPEDPYEEQVRHLGELLGYESTRPDKQLGKGPDVLWVDEKNKQALLIELKTGYTEQIKKPNEFFLSKEKIGQVNQHIMWYQNESGYQINEMLGCIILAPDIPIHHTASPHQNIKKLTIENYRNFVNDFIDDIRRSKTGANFDYCTFEQYSIQKLLELRTEFATFNPPK